MNRQEVKQCLTCECGGEFEYDGYDTIEIEDGYIVIKGDCYCTNCRKHKNYKELHKVDFNKPFDLTLT